MTDDLVKKLRTGEFWKAESWYENGKRHRSVTYLNMFPGTIEEAADRIGYLERELGEERHSREVAAAKGWEFSDRIKRLEGILKRAVDGYDKAYCRDEVDFNWVDDAKAALEETK